MNRDRMFQVLVVGGAALIGTTTMSAVTIACGGDVSTDASGTRDAADEGFPSELGAPAPDASDARAEADAFPREGPAMIDAGSDAADAPPDVHDAAAEADAFPREGPAMLDAGSG